MDKAGYIALIREAASPLEPDPPELPPSLEALVYPGACGPLGGIRAVLLDIYGTLFASAAGEIGAGGEARGNIDALARDYAPECTGEELREAFTRAVLDAHRRLAAKKACPEIRVEELWAALAGGPVKAGPFFDPRELALRYELAVNPSFPMPGAGELFARLKGSGLTLGLISNAQFFTPLLFDAFFGGPPEALGFDGALIIYSFEEGEAKPSPRLFSKAAAVLGSRGIRPEEVLYTGNDMLNDIHPAAVTGFKTALFAGDRRSLRIRGENPLVGELLPTRVIRDLSCIPSLLGADRADP
ncbi:MAG: HAD family hydrolase [Spirochaetaceae bacterium]|nr:HAD family hydrolase [Spirochaetaceae bacterium]